MDKWETELAIHHNTVTKLYGYNHVFATMLYGSQNYKLSLPTSDVDTKVMLLPNFRDFCLSMKQTSTEHEAGDGLTNVKDLRLMFQNFLKSNINFLEVLYTEYVIVNHEYLDFWDELINNRELISNYNPRQLMHAAAGMAQQKYVAFAKPFESKADVLKKYNYDPKQLHHLCRLAMFMNQYLESQSFGNSLIQPEHDRNWLMSLKECPLPLHEAEILKERVKKSIDELLAVADVRFTAEPNLEAKEFLDDLAVRMLTKHFKKQLEV